MDYTYAWQAGVRDLDDRFMVMICSKVFALGD